MEKVCEELIAGHAMKLLRVRLRILVDGACVVVISIIIIIIITTTTTTTTIIIIIITVVISINELWLLFVVRVGV